MKTLALWILSSLACFGQLGNPAFVGSLAPATAASVWSPTNISGLILWFKADALSLSDGNNVDGFVDLSSAHNNFTNITGGATYPVFHTGGVNGLPYIQFTAANSTRLRAASLSDVSLGTAYSIFAVVAPGTVTANQVILGDVSAGNWYWINNSGVPNLWVTFHNALSTATLTLNAWVYLEAVRNGTAVSWWVSAAASGTPTLAANDAGAFQYMGAEGGGTYFTGKITELLIYNSALSPTDRGSVETYLHTRTGL